MRFLFSVFAAGFIFLAQPCAAQQNTTAATSEFAASHLGAARDTLQAMMLDTNSLSLASLEAFRLLTPQFRGQIQASPFYASLTSQRQQAVTEYIDGFAVIGQAETLRGAPDLLDRFSPRMAALFTERELSDIAAFMRTPEGSSFFLRSVIDGVRAEAPGGAPPATQPSDAETAALLRFAQTPGGVAMDQREPQLSPLMREFGEAATGAPHISQRLQRDLCAIAGEQCPPAWRAN